ncbi:MAG: hypothetical protein LBT78_09075 [Tannerella sp.]|jgi:hypothetical protein|nr:hypothetical protein [Tannerella sp.]
MRKVMVWSLLLLPFCVEAQRQTEYNQKGDEAMVRTDYQDAKMWYEEGVSYCDPYSINQLISIWRSNATMRVSMGPVMGKCLSCLNNSAISRDSLSIKKLILFYTEGIGTPKNEVSANYWKEQLMQLRNPYAAEALRPKKPREPMKFFVGYSFSPVAPYGIQVGGVGTVGWYLRARSDLVFQSYEKNLTCKNGQAVEDHYSGIIPELPDETYHFLPAGDKTLAEGKKSMLIGSAGMVFKVVPDVYLSAGAGYVKYEVTYEYETIDKTTSLPTGKTGRVKNVDQSYEGVAVDVDATVVFGKWFYGTAGCSILHFKYIYPTVGVGVFF